MEGKRGKGKGEREKGKGEHCIFPRELGDETLNPS
jgi:hypothetical protein